MNTQYHKPDLIVNFCGYIFISKNASFVKPETFLRYHILTGTFGRDVNVPIIYSYFHRIDINDCR